MDAVPGWTGGAEPPAVIFDVLAGWTPDGANAEGRMAVTIVDDWA